MDTVGVEDYKVFVGRATAVTLLSVMVTKLDTQPKSFQRGTLEEFSSPSLRSRQSVEHNESMVARTSMICKGLA